ncbi:MAG TPA: hypothetical protein EYP53_09845 [Candidatus Latescibacteria bacterium]|nr:hypothetical protein [Candidatus Latescibacterota bacterium]
MDIRKSTKGQDRLVDRDMGRSDFPGQARILQGSAYHHLGGGAGKGAQVAFFTKGTVREARWLTRRTKSRPPFMAYLTFMSPTTFNSDARAFVAALSHP